MGSSLSSVSDLLRHRRTMPRFKITAILLVLAMIVSSPPTVDGGRKQLLQRIGAHTVMKYTREQRAAAGSSSAASSSASASSSGAGTGEASSSGVETKPQENILNAEGQAQADRGSALLGGEDDERVFV